MLIDRFGRGVLSAPSGTAGAGGGGGEDKPLTMESVLAEVNKVVEGKIASQFDKFSKDTLGPSIDKKLEPITSNLTGISEAINKLTANPPNQSNPPKPGDVPPELNVTLKKLQETTQAQGKQIETLTKLKEEADQRAERSERHSVIRTSLSNLHFITEQAGQTAFSIVEPFIKRLEDNSLVGAIPNGDNFPVDAFVKDYLTKEHPYLLRASGVSGSGAPSGTGVRMGVKADIGDIKPGMKSETRESVVASIAAALQNA